MTAGDSESFFVAHLLGLLTAIPPLLRRHVGHSLFASLDGGCASGARIGAASPWNCPSLRKLAIVDKLGDQDPYCRIGVVGKTAKSATDVELAGTARHSMVVH